MSTRSGGMSLTGARGVSNGFSTGDRGRERTAPGIQVEDITDERVIKGVEGSVDVKGRTHLEVMVGLVGLKDLGCIS